MPLTLFWEGFASGGAVAVAALLALWWWITARGAASDPARAPSLAHATSVSDAGSAPPATSPSRVPPAGDLGGPPVPSPAPRLSARSEAGPAGTGQVPPAPDSLRSEVLLAQRILVHVALQGRLGPEDVPPRALCQAGMVAALGVGQGTLTGSLRTLVEGGLLSVRKEHAQGVPRRVKVYRLTSRGEILARDLRARRVVPPESGATGAKRPAGGGARSPSEPAA